MTDITVPQIVQSQHVHVQGIDKCYISIDKFQQSLKIVLLQKKLLVLHNFCEQVFQTLSMHQHIIYLKRISILNLSFHFKYQSAFEYVPLTLPLATNYVKSIYCTLILYSLASYFYLSIFRLPSYYKLKRFNRRLLDRLNRVT